MGVVATVLLLVIAYVKTYWQVIMVINFLAFGAYQVLFCVSTVVISQTTDRYAIVFTFNGFLSLVIASVVQEIGVAVSFELSSGYYMLGACFFVLVIVCGIFTFCFVKE